jgi:hypothetical protein
MMSPRMGRFAHRKRVYTSPEHQSNHVTLWSGLHWCTWTRRPSKSPRPGSTEIRLGAEQLRFAHGRPGRLQDGRAEAPQPIPPSDRLEKIHPAAINYAWEEARMRMVLAIAALVSIAFGLIAVGRAWYEFRPLTDKERARLRQEGN